MWTSLDLFLKQEICQLLDANSLISLARTCKANHQICKPFLNKLYDIEVTQPVQILQEFINIRSHDNYSDRLTHSCNQLVRERPVNFAQIKISFSNKKVKSRSLDYYKFLTKKIAYLVKPSDRCLTVNDIIKGLSYAVDFETVCLIYSFRCKKNKLTIKIRE